MIFFQNVKSSRQIGGCKKLLNEFPKEAIKTCYIVDLNNQFLHYLNGKHRPLADKFTYSGDPNTGTIWLPDFY